ncbi:SCO7613 C-terminal domain-containing membrane protein [Niallia sp. NCCP-28]|uniref:SCO7613 C-terminal domain-containing membrane protein n=1 Tax=Niallia sp. NCCP-28 TaxID=2934712 RepID=UPI00207E07E2|nr:hypothetical protein [Niallia sp. NCCP-28]GKU82776.1 hypothetical protein NCCP28_21720 [Niallia sp. NCCP-28]
MVKNSNLHKSIFLHELKALQINGYITNAEYNHIFTRYEIYLTDNLVESKAISKAIKKEEKKETAKVKTVPEKVRTPEQLKERNMGLILYIGVMLLLIGGLFVATSNWNSMNDWMKAGSIFFISFLFYCFAIFAKKIVKIEKTAFAFFILGSLFLPIGNLSLSWFGLLGTYFSYHGKGNFLFGAISALLFIPFYYWLSIRLASSFFRILTLTAVSTAGIFILLVFHPTEALFFLLFTIFISLFFFFLSYSKKKSLFFAFQKELPGFIQIQVIATMMGVLFWSSQPILQGINFLLLSALFIGIIYGTKIIYYHFLASAMILLAMFRIFSIDSLSFVSPILFVCASMVVMMFGSVLKGTIKWGRIWEYTSIVFVAMMIIYRLVVDYQEMMQGSFIYACTYLLIACQFIYLANLLAYSIYRFFPALFTSMALWQVILTADFIQSVQTLFIALFSIGFFLFIILGCNPLKQIKAVKKSSQIAAFIVMTAMLFLSMYLYIGKGFVFIEALVFTFCLTIAFVKRWFQKNKQAVSAALVLSVAITFFTFLHTIQFIHIKGLALSISLTGLLIWLIRKFIFYKSKYLQEIAFRMGQGIYLFAIFVAISYPVPVVWVRAFIYGVAVVMFLFCYRRKHEEWVVWIISILSVMTYLAALPVFFVDAGIRAYGYEYGWILFFLLSMFGSNKRFKNAYFVMFHFYLVCSIVWLVVFWENKDSLPFLFGCAAYLYSSIKLRIPWQKIVCQYVSFICLFVFLLRIFHYIDIVENGTFLSFFLTSVFIVVCIFCYRKDKRNIAVWFFFPFSFTGMTYGLFLLEHAEFIYLLMSVYILLYLALSYFTAYHYWNIGGLLLLVATAELWTKKMELGAMSVFYLYSGLGLVLMIIGRLLYKHIIKLGKEKGAYIDFYSLVGILFFLFLYRLNLSIFFAEILPGILISAALFMQKKRLPLKFSPFVVVFALVYLLHPYNGFIQMLAIPSLFVRELILVPVILIVILSKKILKGHYQILINRVEWGILIISFGLLLFDIFISPHIVDVLMLGSLALAAVIGGFYFKYKSYFLVGVIVLLINVLLQTRPYWGNLPWWAYLLIAGTALITVASGYELRKQQKGEKVIKKLMIWKKGLVDRWNKWR